MPYNYVIKPLASRKIWSFYRNVASKYAHTFDEDDTIVIHDACHQQNMHD